MLVKGVAKRATLEGESFLLSGSSVAAFKFPRELASREFMEKLDGKHAGGTQTVKGTRVCVRYTPPTHPWSDEDSSDQGKQGLRGSDISLGDIIIRGLELDMLTSSAQSSSLRPKKLPETPRPENLNQTMELWLVLRQEVRTGICGECRT